LKTASGFEKLAALSRQLFSFSHPGQLGVTIGAALRLCSYYSIAGGAAQVAGGNQVSRRGQHAGREESQQGVKNRQNRYQRVALCPLLAAKSATRPHSNNQTPASPSAMRSDVMAHSCAGRGVFMPAGCSFHHATGHNLLQ